MKTISSNGNITMVRGDTVVFALFINKGSLLVPERYLLKSGDTVYFGIMEENQPFEKAIVKKVYGYYSFRNSNRDLIIKITPVDTENLLSGDYLYTIKLKTADGIVQTLIPERQLTLIG